MRILIVGGAGYIGSHIGLEAINQGYEVTVFDDLSTGFKKNIHPSANFFKGSTLFEEDLNQVMKKNSFDVVIHLAGCKAAGESMINPSKYAQNNIIGGINLLKACVDNEVDKFIFSSSAAVYGIPKHNPIDESHPLLPINYYGHTKLLLENNLKWFSDLNKIRYASLRYFNAAGYDLEEKILEKEKHPQNLIPIVMETAVQKRDKLFVFGNDYDTKDGTGIRDYIHVTDLAVGHLSALKYISEKNKDLVVNLGTGRGHSVLDIINMTKNVSGKNIEYNFSDRRAGDPNIVIAGSNKAEKLINWAPKHSDLHTIIESTWNIYNQ